MSDPSSRSRGAGGRLMGLLALAVFLVAVLAVASVWMIRAYLHPAQEPVTLTNPRAESVPASGVRIGGVVQDEQGRPVANAQVELQWLQAPATQTATPARSQWKFARPVTDANGHWTYAGIGRDATSSMTVNLTQNEYVRLSVPKPPLEALLAGSAVFVMSRGFDVTGKLVDAAGQPVGGVRVTTAAGMDNTSAPSARSGSDGSFVIHHVADGQVNLLAMAKGYGPAVAATTVDVNAQPVVMVMQPGQTISGQIVDGAGQPLAGVTAALNFWNDMSEPRITATSDAQGRFELRDLPAGRLDIQFYKSGYESPGASLTPGDPPPLITLRMLPTFSGKVTDADTHQPIASFRVMDGRMWPRARAPVFSFLKAKPFSDGRYSFQAGPFNGTVAAWYLRADADGYLPVIGPPLTTGGPVAQDLEMHRAPDIEVSLIDAAGKPVIGVDLLMLIPSCGVYVSNGSPFLHDNYAQLGKSDPQGHFSFYPQSAPFEIWAISDGGCARFRCAEYDGKPVEMKLAPWATLRLHGAPGGAEGKSEGLGLVEAADPMELPNFSRWSFIAKVDGKGVSEITRLPAAFPEGLGIAEWYMRGTEPLSGWRSAVVRLRPGETTELDPSGGVTIAGHVAPATAADDVGKVGAQVMLEARPNGPAANWPPDALAAARAARGIFSFSGSADPSGGFHLGGVAPGQYEYAILPGTDPQITCGSGLLTVPAGVAEFTAPEMSYAKVAKLKIGDSAPPVLGRTLDEKPIRTADFAGKYVIWMVWNIGIGGHEGDSAAVRALAERFAAVKRVAMVAVNADRATENFTCPPMRPAALAQSGWINGYMSLIDDPVILSLALYDQDGPKLCVIDPAGKIIAIDMPPDNLGDKLFEFLRAP